MNASLFIGYSVVISEAGPLIYAKEKTAKINPEQDNTCDGQKEEFLLEVIYNNHLVQVPDHYKADQKFKHIIKGIVHMTFKHWQTWDIDHLFSKPIPEADLSLFKEVVLNIQSQPSWHSFETFPHILSLGTREKSSAPPPLLLIGKLQGGACKSVPLTEESSLEGMTEIFLTTTKLSVCWHSTNHRWNILSAPGWKQQKHDLSATAGKETSWLIEKMET